MPAFEVVADFAPAGDQGSAIAALCRGLDNGYRHQTLKGVTGSGKTFSMAKIIEAAQAPTLVISHNKTLAAQLYREFKDFLPHNAVEYFVSYYDYYQPEAYVASRDLYIEKDASINDEIERLRLGATTALMERRDVVVVATVSCIYGLGSPDDYRDMRVELEVGTEVEPRRLMRRLVALQYTRNDAVLMRAGFRSRGEVIEVLPAARQGRAAHRILRRRDRTPAPHRPADRQYPGGIGVQRGLPGQALRHPRGAAGAGGWSRSARSWRYATSSSCSRVSWWRRSAC